MKNPRPRWYESVPRFAGVLSQQLKSDAARLDLMLIFMFLAHVPSAKIDHRDGLVDQAEARAAQIRRSQKEARAGGPLAVV